MKKPIILFLVISIVAAVGDIKTGKITNQLVLGGYVLVIIVQCLQTGIQSLGVSFLGSLFVIIILFPLFLNRTFGAGDLKLMSIAGFLFSIPAYQKILIFIGISILSGAILALLIMCVQRRFVPKIHFSIPIVISTAFYLGGVY